MQIYENKRNCLHKKRIQLPQDWLGTPTWLPSHCFGTNVAKSCANLLEQEKVLHKKKVLTPTRPALGQQYGRRFIVFGH